MIEKRCLSCGYDLRGLSEPRCPECGRAFNLNKAESYYVRHHPIDNLLRWSIASLCILAAAPVMALVPRGFGVDSIDDDGPHWVLTVGWLGVCMTPWCALVSLGMSAVTMFEGLRIVRGGALSRGRRKRFIVAMCIAALILGVASLVAGFLIWKLLFRQ